MLHKLPKDCFGGIGLMDELILVPRQGVFIVHPSYTNHMHMKNEVLMDQPIPLLKTNKNVSETVMDELIP